MPKQQDAHVALLRGRDDRVEVRLQFRWRQASQAVVGAERHDQHAHVALERPVETPQTAGRRVTRNARVDHLVIEAGGREAAFEERGYA